MTAPGTILFSGLSIGKETVAGTTVATTRALYPDGMGLLTIDKQKSRMEGAQRGTASNITSEVQQGQIVNIAFKTASSRGLTFNDSNFMFTNLKGGVTPSAASSAITYAYVPAQTGDPAAETFTLEVYSDIQELEVGYCLARGFSISAARGGMTQGTIDWFGKVVAKSTKTTPVHNNDVTIPGYLWTPKFATSAAGLAGASISTNFLRSFQLDVDTGYRPQFYLDGGLGFGQAVRSQNMGGKISLVVDDTALAFSEIYDKADAGTVDFVRLKATGPALSAANYDLQLDFPVLWDDPSLWAADSDGVNTHTATGVLAYDSTFANALKATLVCSMTALTA